MDQIPVATIGFTKSIAERFFERLLAAGVTKVIDVRLHNTSQLAGFAKAEDLAYLLGKIGGIGYVHEPLLAPTDDAVASISGDSPVTVTVSAIAATFNVKSIERF